MRSRLFLWLLILPLILSCYGGWQYYRTSELTEAIDNIKLLHTEATQLLQTDPEVIMEIDGTSFTVKQIFDKTNEIISSQEVTFNEFQSIFDLGTIGGGALSLLLGGFAILLCMRSGIVARKSRDELLKVFDRCRRLLPFILVGQMTLIGISIFSLISYEILWFINNFEMRGGGAKIIVAAGVAALAILWCIIKGIAKLKHCFAMFSPSASHLTGKSVTPEEAPGLWQWINELAEQVGTEPPDNIVVGLTECFFVTSYPVCVNNEQVLEGRTLYFPLIYGALLSREESAAVIGHELGHFTGEDTTYSLHFSPIYAGMNRSIDVMISNIKDKEDYYSRLVMSPSIYLGIFFIQQFDFAVNHWSRIREYAADAVGARLSSAQAISSALLRISAVSEAVSQQLSVLFAGKLKADELLPVIIDNLRENGIPDANQFLENELTHPTDTHPTTKSRIEALKQPIEQELLDYASRPVEAGHYDNIDDLFADAKALSVELTQNLSGEIDEYYQEQRQIWEEQAASLSETTALTVSSKRNLMFLLTLILMIIVGSGFFLSFMIKEIKEINSGNILVILLIFAVIVSVNLLCLLFPIIIYKRCKNSMIILEPTKISGPDFQAPYPLHNIIDFNYATFDSFLFKSSTLTFELADNATLPDMTPKKRLGRGKLKKKKRRLFYYFGGTLKANGKKISDQEVIEIIHNYLQAAHAQHALNQHKFDE
ncbi:M48 family metallopeptidase [Photorhabdus luminescens]|uniref:Peptidase M48, Ste24p n=1 Tax=Photorhabdus luminescens subsp. sonorensis TaxID=1173677 RepID=A0A5C4RMG8_PHOLU|nr:M48 family metallopeptidase [Photorhabdus luminescens]TNH44891.1 peptidase M48, Ste24p [Photorhabdus luminescens subsp. sonorensis]